MKDNKKKNKLKLEEEPKIVVIGGGTGLSILLRGLKFYTANITAIVTVSDDGGGSGVLREDLGMLPPGDIRSCLLALANTEPTMEKLLEFRFEDGMLKGQNFGNLFLAAMDSIYGSFEKAVREASNVLAITGKVLPMTLENVKLCAVLENGQTIVGESRIPIDAIKSSSRIDYIYMDPKMSYPLSESVQALKEADIIAFGPGSLYTSIMPNLLVNNIIDTIHNSGAKKVYISNVMTQPGETDGYSLTDHVDAIIKHSRPGFLDYVIGNTEEIPIRVFNEYIKDGLKPVLIQRGDHEILREQGIHLIGEKLINIEKGYTIHDNMLLSKVLMSIAKDEYIGKTS